MTNRPIRALTALITAVTLMTSSFALTASAAYAPEASGAAAEISESGRMLTGNSDDYFYEIKPDGTLRIISFGKTHTDTREVSGEEFALPNEINGMKVSEITGFTVYSSDNTQRLFIPENITCIDEKFGITRNPIETSDSGKTLMRKTGRDEFKEFVVDENNPAFTAKDGILYSKDMKKLLRCPCEYEGEVVVPDSVEEIGYMAFYDCTKVTSVKLPDGLKRIYNDAFGNCTSTLQSINIPKSLEYIAYGALFFNKDGFCFTPYIETESEDVMGQVFLKVCGFENKTGVSTGKVSGYGYNGNTEEEKPVVTIDNIPSEIDGITVRAVGLGFKTENLTLDSIHLPDTIRLIEQNAFSLTSGDFNYSLIGAKSKFMLGAAITGYKGKSGEVVIPSEIEGLPVGWVLSIARSKSGSKYDQEDVEPITSVVIPEGVEFIGNSAFREQTQLKKVTLPESLEKIGYNAFDTCLSLEEINFPEGLKEIWNYAFYNCRSLKNVNVPKTTKLGVDVFKIDNNSYYSIPADSDSDTDNEPYEYSDEFTSGDYVCRYVTEKATGKKTVEILFCKVNESKITVPSKIEGVEVTSLGYAVFSYKRTEKPSGNMAWYPSNPDSDEDLDLCSISELKLPDTLTSIDTMLGDRLEVRTGQEYRDEAGFIYDNLIYTYYIDEYTGKLAVSIIGLTKLSPNLEIPSHINGVPVRKIAFAGFGSMEERQYGEDATYTTRESIWDIEYMYDEYSKAMRYSIEYITSTKWGEDGMVPNEDYDVEENHKKQVKSVTIPDTVNTITSFAPFYMLEEIKLPESLIYIRMEAFSCCSALKKVFIPKSVTDMTTTYWNAWEGNVTVDLSPFTNCESLEEIEVDEENPSYCSVDGVLYSKDKKKLIQYPAGRKDSQFTVPSFVEEIVAAHFIPASMARVTRGAFSYNSYLEKLVISEGTVVLQEGALTLCPSLRTIAFPKSVQAITCESFPLAFKKANQVNLSAYSNRHCRIIIEGIKGSFAEMALAPYYEFRYIDESELIAPIETKDTPTEADPTETKDTPTTPIQETEDTPTDTDTETADTPTDSDVKDETSDIAETQDTPTDTDVKADTQDTPTDTDVKVDTQDTATDIDTSTDTETETDSSTDTETHSEPKGKYGDLDGDDTITANDALIILRASVGMGEIAAEKTAAADLDKDKVITANDALAVLRFSVSLAEAGSIVGTNIPS